MLLLNDGKTEASDIRSAWGLDDDTDQPVAEEIEKDSTLVLDESTDTESGEEV